MKARCPLLVALGSACLAAGSWAQEQRSTGDARIQEAAPAVQEPQATARFEVGSSVHLGGALAPDGKFHATSVMPGQPTNSILLVGTVSAVDAGNERFTLLGLRLRVTAKTRLEGLALAELAGKRVWVDARWHGESNYSARIVRAEPAGDDSIEGRIDALENAASGHAVVLSGFRAILPGAEEHALESAITAPEGARPAEHETPAAASSEREDYVPPVLHLGQDLTLGAMLEEGYTRRRDYDLDSAAGRDRTREYLFLRAKAEWRPSESFQARIVERYEYADVHHSDGSNSSKLYPRLEEARVQWSDLFGTPLDLRVGRQKFVDDREWIYRSYLDAARLIWNQPGFRCELSASTVLSEGTTHDEHTTNWMALISNNDHKRELAAWVLDRRDYQDPRDLPIFFGARAYGEWIPHNRIWVDACLLRGYTGTVNLRGWAFDLGTTWSPPPLAPLSFTLGLAQGSGDSAQTTTVDETFRQTGLQLNRDKWAGVVNFHYYGELLDPELSNLSILSAGLGVKVAPKVSLDVVYHDYRQLVAANSLRNSNLTIQPSGLETDVGREWDLILGSKALEGWDFEFVLARFLPGSAFPGADKASLAGLTIRYRF